MSKPYTTLPEPKSHEEWLEMRRLGIGSSDAPAVCNASKWGTPASVWANKVWHVEVEETQEMKIGKLMEPLIAGLYERETGRTLTTCPMLQSKDRPWQLANLDRVTEDGDQRPVELKNSNSPNWGTTGSDAVPVGYFIQVHHQADVYPSEKVDIAALLHGSDFRTYEIEIVPAIVLRIRQIEADFWGLVESKEQPPFDFTHPTATELIQLLHPPVEGMGAEFPCGHQAVMMVEQFEECGKAIKDLQDQRATLKAQIIAAMGSSSVASLPDGRIVRRKIVTRKEYTAPRTSYEDFRILKGRD